MNNIFNIVTVMFDGVQHWRDRQLFLQMLMYFFIVYLFFGLGLQDCKCMQVTLLFDSWNLQRGGGHICYGYPCIKCNSKFHLDVVLCNTFFTGEYTPPQ